MFSDPIFSRHWGEYLFYESASNSVMKRFHDSSGLYSPAGNSGGLFEYRPVLVGFEDDKWQ